MRPNQVGHPQVACRTLVCHDLKLCKRRFGDDGAESCLFFERLQQQGGSHGFAEAIHALRSRLFEPVDPATDIVGFLDPVGCDLAAAFTVGAGVGQKNAVSLFQKQAAVSGHAFAVVADAMHQNHGGAIVILRTHVPGFQDGAIFGGDRNIFERGVMVFAHNLSDFCALRYGTPGRV